MFHKWCKKDHTKLSDFKAPSSNRNRINKAQKEQNTVAHGNSPNMKSLINSHYSQIRLGMLSMIKVCHMHYSNGIYEHYAIIMLET